MTERAADDQPLALRRWVIMLLIVISLSVALARIAHVTAGDKRTPFLSANDRSRWCTVLSLLEHQTYEIDQVIKRRGWDSIDKVSHPGNDGQQHFYSSKPPIIAFALAWETWLVQKVTGKRLADAPFYVGRVVIAITNGSLLVLLFAVTWRSVERWGTTDAGRIFVMACVTIGTLLTTFAISINNHLPAAVATAIAIYLLLRVWYDEPPTEFDDVDIDEPPQRSSPAAWRFALAGFAAATAAACELPALALLVAVLIALAIKSPLKTLVAALPAAAVVVGIFFATNLAAHDSWRPPYAHRAAGEDWTGDNWYLYEGSYWQPGVRKGFDVGEPSKMRYAFHVIMGHHGILSLTPIWLLSMVGAIQWLSAERRRIGLVLAVVGLTTVCLVFFIGMRPLGDRNYGGSCCGFRWMFWLIPLWLLAMIPAADTFCQSRWGRALVLTLLAVSIFSATYPLLNCWTHPWLWAYWKNLGWI